MARPQSRSVGVNDKGMRVGQWHHNAKLTDADRDRLIEMREAGAGWKSLAKKFDISVRHVRDICAGKRHQMATRWKTVPIK